MRLPPLESAQLITSAGGDMLLLLTDPDWDKHSKSRASAERGLCVFREPRSPNAATRIKPYALWADFDSQQQLFKRGQRQGFQVC